MMLGELMQDLEFIESKIERLERTIATRIDAEPLARLCTIPGVSAITAWTLLAELGSDMSVFRGPKNAASWAGLCPGNHESGGKRLSNRTRIHLTEAQGKRGNERGSATAGTEVSRIQLYCRSGGQACHCAKGSGSGSR
jgi:transposase